MRKTTVTLGLIGVALFLSACGNKGVLTLPPRPTAAPAAPPAAKITPATDHSSAPPAAPAR